MTCGGGSSRCCRLRDWHEAGVRNQLLPLLDVIPPPGALNAPAYLASSDGASRRVSFCGLRTT